MIYIEPAEDPRYDAEMQLIAKIGIHFSFYLCIIKPGKKPSESAQYASGEGHI